MLICAATFLCGLGEAILPSLQAVALSTISVSYNAALFTFLAAIDTVAKLIGAPLMAFLFSIRDVDGLSHGLCFLLSAVGLSKNPIKSLLCSTSRSAFLRYS